MKTIFLIRHAKSSWDEPNLRDIDRPLNKRGKGDAPLMAKILKSETDNIDHLISSPAVRALTSCKVFANELDYPLHEITINNEIYGASTSSMLNLINELDNQWQSICIFGHNPTFTYLAESLADINIGNLPTCGIVGIRFSTDDWAAISMGSGEEFLYTYPKMHK